jgi:hypothetical protein
MRNEKGLWKRLLGGFPHSTKIVIFGLVQLVFTIVTVLMAWPMFYSYRLSLTWQVKPHRRLDRKSDHIDNDVDGCRGGSGNMMLLPMTMIAGNGGID